MLLGKAGRSKGVKWSRSRREVWTDERTRHWTVASSRHGRWDGCPVLGHYSGSRQGAYGEDKLVQ